MYVLLTQQANFMKINCLALFLLFIVSQFYSKPILRVCHKIYNLFHRITMILLHMIFVYSIYETTNMPLNVKFFNIQFLNILTFNNFFIQMLLFEYSSIIAVYIMGKKITSKRFIYTMSSILLAIQYLLMDQKLGHITLGPLYPFYLFIHPLPLLFFVVNFICDSTKDLMYIFGINHKVVRYVYSIFKPAGFLIIIILANFNKFSFGQMIIPTLITSLSIRDGQDRLKID